MVFAAPRDGRFTDTRTLPVGVKLQTDLGTPWLDLTGAVADVAVSPLFCDIGFFGGPIPFGFTPGKKFDVGAGPKVGGEDTPIDPATFDERARQALAEGLAAAALYYDGSGQSFSEVAADDLVARAPRLSFVAHDPDSEPPGEVDTVYFALRPDDDRYFYAVTRSRSGRWFCAGVVPHISVVALDAFDLAEITKTCFPDTTVEEG